MELSEQGMAVLAAACALIGIALLFFLSETPKSASVADALLSNENSLLEVRGSAANVTPDKFLLCQGGLCISVRKGGVASAELVSSGDPVMVHGRVKEYRGNRYIEAERVEKGG